MFRGVYVETSRWDALPPWEKYLVRLHAALAADPQRVFYGESAAALLGVLIPYQNRPVHILAKGPSSREYRGVRTHVSVDEREIICVDGIHLTSPTATADDVRAIDRPPSPSHTWMRSCASIRTRRLTWSSH
ncbi:hypothetical protein ACWGJP_14515 [Microbacterium sp. NPDC055903]